MYDYKLVSEFEDGSIKSTTYQTLIARLGIASEEYMAAPLSEGGTPQCLYVMQTIKPLVKGLKKITAYFDGQIIATF